MEHRRAERPDPFSRELAERQRRMYAALKRNPKYRKMAQEATMHYLFSALRTRTAFVIVSIPVVALLLYYLVF